MLAPNLTSTFELFIYQEMRSTKVKAKKEINLKLENNKDS